MPYFCFWLILKWWTSPPTSTNQEIESQRTVLKTGQQALMNRNPQETEEPSRWNPCLLAHHMAPVGPDLQETGRRHWGTQLSSSTAHGYNMVPGHHSCKGGGERHPIGQPCAQQTLRGSMTRRTKGKLERSGEWDCPRLPPSSRG